MAYRTIDRTASGIVFFGPTPSDQTFESNSNFRIDTSNNRAIMSNITLADSGWIGSATRTGILNFGANGFATFSSGVVVQGDLIVQGTTTTINSETITLDDNIIVLNNNYTGATPTENAGIEVERGTQTNVQFIWDETSDFWSFSNTAGTYFEIASRTGTQNLLNKTIDGSLNTLSNIGNASLTNSSVTVTAGNGLINGGSVSLGGSVTLDVGAGAGVTVAANTVAVTDGSGILVDAGGVHANLISYATQSVAANAASSTASRTYPIQVNGSDQLVVNVPWTDTGMTFTVSDGTNTQTISNSDTLRFQAGAAINFTVSATDTVSGTLNAAVAGNGLTMSNQVLNIGAGAGITVAADSISVTDGSGILINNGGVHANLVDWTTQTTAANAVTTTASRTYAIQANGSDQLVVNVPWTDTGMTFSITDGATSQTISNTDTLRFQSGAAINFTVSATDTVSGTLNAAVAGVGLSMSNQVLAVDISEFSIVALASGDSFLTLDSDGATEQRTTITNLGGYFAGAGLVSDGGGVLAVGAGNGISVAADSISVTAGTGISVDANGIHIDLSEYVTPVAFASGDSFLVLDSDGATEQRGTIMNLGSYLAGTNVTAGSDGKLSVTDVTVEGVVFTAANFVDSSRIDFVVTAGQSVTADLIAASVSPTYLSSTVGGSGLFLAGDGLHIDLNEYSSVAVASGDRFLTLDSNAVTEQLTTVTDLGNYLAGAGIVSDGGGVLSVNTDGSTLEVNADVVRIKDNGVTDAKLRQSAGLSVVGRSANTTGNVADITAGTDGHVLRRSGTSLTFGFVTAANLSRSVVTITNTGTALVANACDIVIMSAASLAASATLPAPSTGALIVFKRTDSSTNTCTINRNAAETIDGATSIQLYYQYESVTLVSDGTNWFVV